MGGLDGGERCEKDEWMIATFNTGHTYIRTYPLGRTGLILGSSG